MKAVVTFLFAFSAIAGGTIFSAAAAQNPRLDIPATPPAPAPPVMVRSPSSLPPITDAGDAEFAAERVKVITFDIEIRAGRDLLWADSLRTSAAGGGQYSQSKREPLRDCLNQVGLPSLMINRDNQLTVSLARRFVGGRERDDFFLSVTWNRPSESCEQGLSKRTIGYEQSVKIATGETRELHGDGGLLIRLKRRP